MDEIKERFVAGFCKVEVLCHSGEPNWLGWGVLGIGALLTAFFAFLLLAVLIFSVEQMWKRLQP